MQHKIKNQKFRFNGRKGRRHTRRAEQGMVSSTREKNIKPSGKVSEGPNLLRRGKGGLTGVRERRLPDKKEGRCHHGEKGEEGRKNKKWVKRGDNHE